MKHLLKLLDLSKKEIIDILNLADQLKYETKHGIEHHHLKGKCLAMIFEKSSTRTRVSFEVGINQLGRLCRCARGRRLADRSRRAGAGHRTRAFPLCGRHHDPHLRAEGGRRPRKVRLRAGHQRFDGFLPPVPDLSRPHDDPRI